ncbi:hypothetical protein RIF29_28676 [Crotalaria pallida]|uniref:MAPK kinase substrate protein n=1 Tax=Crotalaria pallida TaxID=3830 RepID=A0AAN9ED82_CROPI
MAGLQRSAVSFRRQGSSGFVWDDKFLQEEFNKVNDQKEENHHQEQEQEQDNKGKEVKAHGTTSLASINTTATTIERSRSSGGRGYRTGKVSPAIEPPSPKLSACGFCAAFGKNGDKGSQRSKPGKHRAR